MKNHLTGFLIGIMCLLALNSNSQINDLSSASFGITDVKGCSASTSVTVNTTAGAALNAVATTSNILCNGGTTTVTVSANGGVAPYTGTGTFTVAAGTYIYTVTDAAGETSSVTVTVDEPSVLNILSVNSGGVSACNNTDGSLTVNATGGVLPYQYNLNAGTYQYNNVFSNLSDGIYTVIIKDNNGCLASSSATVTRNETFSASLSEINNVSSCGSADGSITVATTGGTGPFQYSLNGGDFQNGNTFSNLPIAEYTVAVMDSRGCGTSISTSIEQSPAPKVEVTDKSNVSSCGNNDGSITVNGTGGNAPYKYSVDGITYQSSNVLDNLTEGTYTVTVKDSRGCTATVTAKIGKTEILTAEISRINNASSCGINDGSVIAGKTGGIAPYQYSLNGGDYQESNVFNNLSAGIYSLKVKDSRGCIAIIVATISQSDELSLSVTTTDVTCKGGNDGTIELNCNGGEGSYKYNLNGGSFRSSNIFNKLSAGVYEITVKDGKNCTGVVSVTVAEGTGICGLPGIINPDADSIQLKILAMPNPAPAEFTLIIQGNNDEPVEIIVTDMLGRKVYQASGAINQQYRFGKNFASGMYMLRVKKSKKSKTLKLIKKQG